MQRFSSTTEALENIEHQNQRNVLAAHTLGRHLTLTLVRLFANPPTGKALSINVLYFNEI